MKDRRVAVQKVAIVIRKFFSGLVIVVPILTSMALPAFSFELKEIKSSKDTAYLPYRSVELQRLAVNANCAFPLNSSLRVIKPAIRGIRDGLIVYADNPSPNSDGSPRFTPRQFPSFNVGDENPIDYKITTWETLVDSTNARYQIVGVCHSDDSLFAYKLDVKTDSVAYLPLFTIGPEEAGPMVPRAEVFYIGDYDLDSAIDIILYISNRKRFRRLVCLDFATMSIRWEREVSCGLAQQCFYVLEDDLNPRMFFVSGNSGNSMQDDLYDDKFAYFSILNGRGKSYTIGLLAGIRTDLH